MQQVQYHIDKINYAHMADQVASSFPLNGSGERLPLSYLDLCLS